MKICIEGCAHGDLDNIYGQIGEYEERTGQKVDLLICCGDFQATRNKDDLACMAVPPKYLDMCSFYKYHQGESTAPILTLFIGGNHEASNHMQELSYGGWVAPNIYYLGNAGVVNVNGIRIGGISGIYKGYNYEKGHFEITPYTNDTVRSVYSIRNLEVFRLCQLTPSKVDIMISHDWPSYIWDYGDGSRTGSKEGLLRFKPHFKDDIESGRLGSWPCWELLLKLKPRYWYSAHLHCRFDAIVKHNEDDEEKEDAEQTKFVALDKCLPRRQFLDFIDVGEEVERREDGTAIIDFQYDAEWLAILSLTNKFLNCTESRTRLPQIPTDLTSEDAPRWNFTPSEEDIAAILQKFKNNLKIPQNFTQMVNGYNPQWDGRNFYNLRQPEPMINPQTTDFCSKLDIDDPLFVIASLKGLSITQKAVSKDLTTESPRKSQLSLPKPVNSEEIDLDDLDDEEISTKIEKEKEVAEEGVVKEIFKEDVEKEEKEIEEKQETKSEEAIVPPKRETSEISSPTANQTAAKKFKRRNQELRNDDDEN